MDLDLGRICELWKSCDPFPLIPLGFVGFKDSVEADDETGFEKDRSLSFFFIVGWNFWTLLQKFGFSVGFVSRKFQKLLLENLRMQFLQCQCTKWDDLQNISTGKSVKLWSLHFMNPTSLFIVCPTWCHFFDVLNNQMTQSLRSFPLSFWSFKILMFI